MIVVKVELHSARTGKVSELARAVIWNKGGTEARGDYGCRSYRKGSRLSDGVDENVVRSGEVLGHARRAEHVFNLVAKALLAMGYRRPS